MLLNYLKIGYRSILKNKKSSIINSIGLGIAFSTCLVLFSFLDRIYNMDKCHVNSDRKYLIEHVIIDDGRERIFGDTPFALAASIREEIPEVENVIRMQYTQADFRFDDKVFKEQVIFADDGFMDMFTFDLASGSQDVLNQKDRIAISKSIAKKYFGDKDPVGKQVSLLFSVNGSDYKETYIVGAVADDFDYMTTIRFQVLIPFQSRKNLGLFEDSDWINKTNATFVELQHPDQAQKVEQQLNGYTKIQHEANPDRKISHFLLDPLSRMALDASGKENMIIYNAPPAARIFLTMIAVFILILAVFNYINISVVSATSRLKEIGLRKTIGSTRKQLIIQFMTENTILCFFALLFGYLLTTGFTLPGFNTLVASNSPLILDFNNSRLWIYIITLFLLVSIGSAAYPAFFISGFRPVHIFKGNLKLGSRNYFAKTLLGIQFIIAFITISLSVVFVMNDKYCQKRDWGYNKEQTIIVPLINTDQYAEMKDVFSQNSSISLISGSENHMGYWTHEDALIYENEQYLSKKIMAGYEYLDVMGLRLKAGRFFEPNSMTDMNESIVVNEALVRQMDLEDAVGTRLLLDNKAAYIIGVVEDFHYLDFSHEVKPFFFKLIDQGNFNFLAISTKPGHAVDTDQFVEATWKKMYPDYTYEGFFQNSSFDVFFKENRSISNIMIAIAGMAILISSMGLFGLVSLYISKRMKEFSIRKVLGASLKELGYQVSRGFMWVLIAGSITGIPFAFFLSESIIKSLYTYHVPIDFIPILFTTLILLATALITVSTQLSKAIGVNPVNQLRND